MPPTFSKAENYAARSTAIIDTLDRAARPTIAYTEGLEKLAEAQARGGLTAEAAAAQQQTLYLALIKGRDAADRRGRGDQ